MFASFTRHTTENIAITACRVTLGDEKTAELAVENMDVRALAELYDRHEQHGESLREALANE